MHESSERGRNRDLRSSALWGTSGRGGDSRSSALWGKGGRGFIVTAVAVLALGAPLAATAAPGPGKAKGPSPSNPSGTFVSTDLQSKAKAHPYDLVKVIIQSSYGTTDARNKAKGLGQLMKLGRNLDLIGGVSVELPAKLIDKLSKVPGLSITPDAPVKTDAFGMTYYRSNQMWPYDNGNAFFWSQSYTPPTIAIVDSGIDAN